MRGGRCFVFEISVGLKHSLPKGRLRPIRLKGQECLKVLKALARDFQSSKIPAGVRRLSYELTASGPESSANAASETHHLCLGGSLSDAAIFESSMLT